MITTSERRISPRWVARKNHAALEFRNYNGNWRMKATLLNISREGALISPEKAIPLGTTMSLRIESPAKTDWIRVVPVRHDGPLRVGIRFARPCLDDLLLAAMLGIDLGSLVLDVGRPPTFDDAGHSE